MTKVEPVVARVKHPGGLDEARGAQLGEDALYEVVDREEGSPAVGEDVVEVSSVVVTEDLKREGEFDLRRGSKTYTGRRTGFIAIHGGLPLALALYDPVRGIAAPGKASAYHGGGS